MNKNIIIGISLLNLFYQLSSAELSSEKNNLDLPRKLIEYQTICGQVVDATNLARIVPQLDQATTKAFNEWAEKNKKFLHKIVPLDTQIIANASISKENIKALQRGINIEINRNDLKNYSRTNIAFPLKIDEKEYFLRSVGVERRTSALFHTNNEQKTISHNSIQPTMQTASQVANYLLCKETIEKYNLDTIDLPKTYLVQIPERPNILDSSTDERCLVLQESIGNFIKTFSRKNSNGIFPNDIQLKQYLALIKYAAFFDTETNLLISCDGKKIILVDFEQSWEENSNDFFNQNSTILKSRIVSGAIGFCAIGGKIPLNVNNKKTINPSTALYQNSTKTWRSAIAILKNDTEVINLWPEAMNKNIRKMELLMEAHTQNLNS